MSVVIESRIVGTFLGYAPGVVHRMDDGSEWEQVGTDQEFSAILDHLESTTGFGFFLVSIPKSDSRTSPSSSK